MAARQAQGYWLMCILIFAIADQPIGYSEVSDY